MANNNFEQTDIFGLFGLEEETEVQTVSLDELTEQPEEKKQELNATETTKRGGFDKVIPETSKENKEEEKKKLSTFEDPKKDSNPSASTTKTKPKSKPSVGDEFKLKIDTLVKYAGQEVPVTRYFTAEQITNGIERKRKGEVVTEPITDKDLIKKLNQDFAELVPQLTSLVYFEKKNIVVPVLQARKKGANVEEESNTDSSFSSPLRIPFQLLQDFIAIAKDYSDQYQTEIHADIYYDYKEKNFFMDFPKQIVHEVWAERTEDPVETALRFIDRDYRKVMEIHSHHRMAPIPSSTDDKAERSPILYAIVGRIDNYFPEITVRTFNPKTQKHVPLKVEQVFEYPFKQTSFQYNLSGVEVAE